MNSTDETPQPTLAVAEDAAPAQADAVKPPVDSMGKYQQLKRDLYLITLGITAVAFVTVAFVYELRVAFNYLLGAVTGIVYLRLLAKDVDRIGNETNKLSLNRMALFVGLMVVAAKWHQLQILPVFLGFLTYKVGLVIYILRGIWLEKQPS